MKRTLLNYFNRIIFLLIMVTFIFGISLKVRAQIKIDQTSQVDQTGQVETCPTITCIWDPCPGKHLPDAQGCINCASPCSEGTKASSPGSVCIQVITPAISPEGICKNFPTPCDVPTGWKKVEKCPAEETSPIKEEISSVIPSLPAAETKTIPISINVCAVSDDYLKEINKLIKEADLAKSQGDLEAEKNITEKIKIIKEKIEARKKECENVSQTQAEERMPSRGPAIAPQTQASLQALPVGQTRTEDFCNLEKQITPKIDYYKELLSLSSKELEDKGYEREEVGKILGELQNEKAKVHSACSGEKVGWTISEIKPVAPQKAEEVTTYYKERVAETMGRAASMETQIQEIKQIKEEVGIMVKELMRSQKEISTQELQPIVDKIVVKPGVIEMKETKVKVQGQKKVETTMNNRPVEILVESQRMNIKEGNLTVETQLPVDLSSSNLVVNNKELKVTPRQVVERVSLKNPIDLKVELVQEKETPVYKVRAVEKRKLLFFIPVNVSKEMTIDATNEQTPKLSEKKPWWSFLVF